MTTPIFDLTEWAAAQSAPWVPHNAALRLFEAAIRGSVLDRDLAAPPGTCADGACYLVAAAATGAWAGKDGKMAVAVGANAANGWLFAAVATEGQVLWVEDEGIRVEYVSAAWSPLASGGAEAFVELSDVPAGYPEGSGGMFVVVKPDRSGLTFSTTGGGETSGGLAAYATSDIWRVVNHSAGVSGDGGEFGEIVFNDETLAAISYAGATFAASSEATGFEATKAADAGFGAGNGWRHDSGTEDADGSWWEATFAAPITPRHMTFYPVAGSNDGSGTWALEYWDGTAFVELDRWTTAAWGGAKNYTLPPAPESAPVTAGDLAALELNDLADVNAPSPANGEALVWDSGTSKWIAGAAASSYTDENARDAVAAMMQDSSTIDFTNNDGADTGTFEVIRSALKPTEHMTIACSDETTGVTTGTNKRTFRMPYAFTVTEVRASVTTAPTGANLIVDINEAGVSILSTKLTIDATEKTSTTAAAPAVISDASLADDAEMTIDFDQVGATIAGAGVKVTLIGYRT